MSSDSISGSGLGSGFGLFRAKAWVGVLAWVQICVQGRDWVGFELRLRLEFEFESRLGLS